MHHQPQYNIPYQRQQPWPSPPINPGIPGTFSEPAFSSENLDGDNFETLDFGIWTHEEAAMMQSAPVLAPIPSVDHGATNNACRNNACRASAPGPMPELLALSAGYVPSLIEQYQVGMPPGVTRNGQSDRIASLGHSIERSHSAGLPDGPTRTGTPDFGHAKSRSVVPALDTIFGRPAMRQEKSQMSHSSIEKQRRDRINSLIEELRDLVPPNAQENPDDGPIDLKRPKHAVLADTISLLKKINVSKVGQAPPTFGRHSQQYTLSHQSFTSDNGSGSAEMDAGGGPASTSIVEVAARAQSAGLSPYTIPQVSLLLDMAASNGVSVDMAAETGHMYLQVRCRNRRGLLADITAALSGLPIEILSGSVMTQDDGMVYDAFELRCNDSALDPYTMQAVVQDVVHRHLANVDSPNRGKRTKSTII